MATNLVVNPVKLRFYTERYNKENQLINVRETFVPTTRTKSLTGKFYAKHDVLSLSDIKEDDVNLIKRQMQMVPKDVYSFRPPAVNMEYGWFAVPLVPVAQDPRLRFSRKQFDFIAIELARQNLQKRLPEKKSNAIPFRT